MSICVCTMEASLLNSQCGLTCLGVQHYHCHHDHHHHCHHQVNIMTWFCRGVRWVCVCIIEASLLHPVWPNLSNKAAASKLPNFPLSGYYTSFVILVYLWKLLHSIFVYKTLFFDLEKCICLKGSPFIFYFRSLFLSMTNWSGRRSRSRG